MQSIGFIGDENDIQQRYHQLKKIYGTAKISILKSVTDHHQPNQFQTVEELVQNSDLIFFGNNASTNKPLLYHTIKKANRVFLDLYTPLPKSTFLKCKAYQEEAGSLVTFNINPYILLRLKIPDSSIENGQILIRSFSKFSHIEAEFYKYLLFGYLYLDCTNTRSHFNILSNPDGTTKVINASLTNLKGRQVNIITGSYSKKINEVQFFDNEGVTSKSIPQAKFFNEPKILKRQLDALYLNKQLTELNQGAALAELMEKMQEKTNQ